MSSKLCKYEQEATVECKTMSTLECHKRKKVLQSEPMEDGISCSHCHIIGEKRNKLVCYQCDQKYHNHPAVEKHERKDLQRMCNICNEDIAVARCDESNRWYCRDCESPIHKKRKADHTRREIQKKDENKVLQSEPMDDGISCAHCHIIGNVECEECNKLFCNQCDQKYHNHPAVEKHERKDLLRMCNICDEDIAVAGCDECNSWYCRDCDAPIHKKRKADHTGREIQKKEEKEESLLKKGQEELQNQLVKIQKKLKTKSNELAKMQKKLNTKSSELVTATNQLENILQERDSAQTKVRDLQKSFRTWQQLNQS